MSILSVDQISPIGSGTTITLNATEVKTGNEITVGTGASIFSPAGNTLTLGTNNTERLRITNAGALGLSGTNYGSSGQVLTSAGSGSAPTWSAIPSQVTINNASGNRVITSDGGTTLNGEANLTFNGTGNFTQTGSSAASIFKVETTATSGDALIQASGEDGSGNTRMIQMRTDAGASQYRIISADTSYDLALCTGNAPRLQISGGGNITVTANSDIRFTNGTWTGEHAGKIQQNSNNLYIQGGTGGIRFRHASSGVNQFSMTNGGNFEITNGDLVVASGHGIDFSADGNASGMGSELLDDYEEGSFTATLSSSGGGASFASGHIQTACLYIKIGSMVHVQGYFSGTNVTNGGTGIVKVSGLPFASNNTTYYTICLTHNTMTAQQCTGAYIQYANTYFFPIQTGSTSGSAFNVGNPRYLMFGGSYPVQF